MFPLAYSIAWRYLWFGKKDKNISFMIRMCFAGITIGTFALMLTVIIFNGFEKVIQEKMQGITSQAIISAPGHRLDDQSIKQVLTTEFADQVDAASSSMTGQVIIERNNQQKVLFLKGVEATTEGKVSSIGQKIVLPCPTKNLSTILTTNQIILGHKAAAELGVSLDKEITLLIPEPGSKHKIYLNKKQAIVAGIFNVGLEEFDSNIAYAALPYVQALFPNEKGVDSIALKLHTPPLSLWTKTFWLQYFGFEPDQETQILTNLKKRLTGLTVSSWRDLYPELFSANKLEKYVMFFILALITLVACMNMVSLLFMQIQNKRRDIAIFKAMGLAHSQINKIFLSIGISITFFASLTGLGLAACAGYMLEKYPFITLPDVYYISSGGKSYLPARMDFEIFVVVFLCTMLLGFFATWIPARRARRINIIEVLRQD